MPNPDDFDTEAAFMKVCVPEVKDEGKSQEQAVGKCSGMWTGRTKTKKAADLAGNLLTPEFLAELKEEK